MEGERIEVPRHCGRMLLLVAHGSRREASNEEVRTLGATLQARAAGFDGVECAFLELTRPGVGEGVERCVARGATEIVVVPYFLAAGNHVVTDIPRLVDEKRREHPAVRIVVAPYVGAVPEMAELLLHCAQAGAEAQER